MQPNNNTEKVVSKPETIGAIMAERLSELGGKIPLHKMNRKARRIHFAKTGERVVGSNKPHLNPDKIEGKVRQQIYATARALGLKYNPWLNELIDEKGNTIRKIDMKAEIEAYKKAFS